MVMNRIDQKFQELKASGQKAFIVFLTAGFPDLAATARLVLEFEKQGVDMVELGVPFSDPIADGPVIQEASYEALKNGVTLKKILALVKGLRLRTNLPLIAMSYYNPILRYGPRRFVRDALECGLDGVIIPDLPPEEEVDFLGEARRRGLDIIFFIAPTTSAERAEFIARQAQGFIYFVSLTGVTGERRSLPKELGAQLRAAKRLSAGLPLCAGFGVSTREQVRCIDSFCDGVIVGSAIIRKIKEAAGASGLIKSAVRFVGALKGKSAHV